MPQCCPLSSRFRRSLSFLHISLLVSAFPFRLTKGYFFRLSALPAGAFIRSAYMPAASGSGMPRFPAFPAQQALQVRLFCRIRFLEMRFTILYGDGSVTNSYAAEGGK